MIINRRRRVRNHLAKDNTQGNHGQDEDDPNSPFPLFVKFFSCFLVSLQSRLLLKFLKGERIKNERHYTPKPR